MYRMKRITWREWQGGVVLLGGYREGGPPCWLPPKADTPVLGAMSTLGCLHKAYQEREQHTLILHAICSLVPFKTSLFLIRSLKIFLMCHTSYMSKMKRGRPLHA